MGVQPQLQQNQNGQEPVSIDRIKVSCLYVLYFWLPNTETQSSQLAELSLADLEQKALFLPRSALSENLEEIGHGTWVVDSKNFNHTLEVTVDVINLIGCI